MGKTKTPNMTSEERKAAVWRLRGQGWTVQAIADEMGVSQPRVSQILKELREAESVSEPVRGQAIKQHHAEHRAIPQIGPGVLPATVRTLGELRDKAIQVLADLLDDAATPPTVAANICMAVIYKEAPPDSQGVEYLDAAPDWMGEHLESERQRSAVKEAS